MSQPNWDKAPEGATHRGMGSGRFYKIEGDQVCCFRTTPAGWEYTGFRVEDYDMHQMIPLPAPAPIPDKPWDGNGLPKVGTVCEGKPGDVDWHRAEVIGYYQERRVWIRWFDPSSPFKYEEFDSWEVDEIEFRPIKTSEQIAAEEREKAINQAWAAIGWTPSRLGPDPVAMLYDLGWRKVEA